MIAPRIPLAQNGQILTANLVNHIIARTEYAARLLREYRCVAGTDMFVEPHYDGTRVSYLQPVGGGATPYKVFLPSRSKSWKTFWITKSHKASLPTDIELMPMIFKSYTEKMQGYGLSLAHPGQLEEMMSHFSLP